MLTLVLALSLAAPVPKPAPPQVEVTAKRTTPSPTLFIDLATGRQELLPRKDDGHYLEVTVKNVSKETISIPYEYGLGDRIYAKVTDAAGKEVSYQGYHHLLRSLAFKPKIHELKPNESFTLEVHLTQDWPELKDRRTPGKYTARIVFEAGTSRGESSTTFEMEIKE